jgi:hypothetical protein
MLKTANVIGRKVRALTKRQKSYIWLDTAAHSMLNTNQIRLAWEIRKGGGVLLTAMSLWLVDKMKYDATPVEWSEAHSFVLDWASKHETKKRGGK